MVILILGLGSQLIDVPFYLRFIVNSGVIPATPSMCLLWWFTDIGLYNGVAILMAWTSLERHIIVFHDQWVSTRKRRILVHYLPLAFLTLYIFIYYIVAFYYFPCENSYDYTLPYCDASPCYMSDPIMGMWDSVVNTAFPSLFEAFLSLAFLFRVIWQRHRSHLPFQWRKQRKMTIQLMSLSLLNMAFNFPLSIIGIIHLCGVAEDIGAEASEYFFFLCYFVIFLIPFICLASITGVKNKFLEKVLRRRPRQLNRFTATVRPWDLRMQMTVVKGLTQFET
ncbi:unnamed protein product [Rotaria sp. Silwood2]|nr:unnamed protein product [Rotaria sp. Silwood2]CAF4077750.1 unnamed protein product [Rotaria sp. Silwood2]